MPSLSPDERARLEEHARFVGRLDAARRVLLPGASFAVETLQFSLIELTREDFAWGGCGNNAGIKARLRVGEGRCARELTIGPEPGIVRHGTLQLALAPESDERAAVLVFA